jgi:hypothetical protein
MINLGGKPFIDDAGYFLVSLAIHGAESENFHVLVTVVSCCYNPLGYKTRLLPLN